jgi:hypothetical protein
MVKLVVLVAVPPGVVTEMGPVVAPVGTVAVIWVLEFTVYVAETWLNLTAVAPVKLVPAIATEVPIGPTVGVKDVIVGAGTGVTSKFVELVAVPSAFVTWIGPSVALLGTVAVMVVSLTTVNDPALRLSNSTSVTTGLLKLVPVIVTVVPTGPLVGVNEVMVGSAACAAVTPISPTNRVLRTATVNNLAGSLRIGPRMSQSLPRSSGQSQTLRSAPEE